MVTSTDNLPKNGPTRIVMVVPERDYDTVVVFPDAVEEGSEPEWEPQLHKINVDSFGNKSYEYLRTLHLKPDENQTERLLSLSLKRIWEHEIPF